MSTDLDVFFADDERRRVVSGGVVKFRQRLNELDSNRNDKYKFLVEFVSVTLFYIGEYPQEFDRRCGMNIAAVGKRFIEEIKACSLDVSDTEHLFVYCYRFLIEYQLGSNLELNSELLSVLGRVTDYEYEGLIASQLRYAGHQMLVNIVQHYIYHPGLVDLKRLPELMRNSELEREKSEELLSEREGRAQELASKLEKYERHFNFVGLYSGFKHLRDAKIRERHWNFGYLIVLGALLISPFLAKLCGVGKSSEKEVVDYFLIATLAGLELLLLYFFRVALYNFRSVKAQLLQIELRMALCQFVQSYAEYAKEVRAGSPGVLEKFEQVVFSGIVNDESTIPSTFDGMEKLAELIGKTRG